MGSPANSPGDPTMFRLLAPLPIFSLMTFAVLAQPPETVAQPKTPRLDQLGDPLPQGALARLGTTRFRHGGRELLGFTPDAKTLLFADGGSLHLMDAVSGKETKVFRFADFDLMRNYRNNGGPPLAISGDAKVL